MVLPGQDIFVFWGMAEARNIRQIELERFALVQDIFAERARDPKHSGATIFSGKIRCGCCGGWYGSKVWHSKDKYRRVIWQCNHKFKDKTRCKTPHLTENEIKVAFVRMVNKLYADRELTITELTAIKTGSVITRLWRRNAGFWMSNLASTPRR